ncbi:MAG: glycosyltransferase [Burkholderiales bacterium]|nr:glycosyltransferase [Burkholderiales bacterium]
MRILYLVHQFFPEFGSGTERVTLNLARMAQRAGHHVRVLACMLERSRHHGQPNPLIPAALDTVVEGIPVTLLDRGTLPGQAEQAFEVAPAVVDQLEPWLHAQRFDVVHLMHSMRMASAVAAAQRCGLPMVATLTDYFPACLRVNLIDQSDRPCDGPQQGRACARKCATPAWNAAALAARHTHSQAMLGYASARVVPSQQVAERYRAAFPDLRFELIAHGVDLLGLMRARPASTEPRPLTLGFIGSIIEPKGLHILLRALARCPQLPVRLRVAGGFHGDEAYQARVRALAEADGRVELLGPRTAAQVAALLHQIDLLCLPSLLPESYSLVVHEGAAAGVPSLVSDLGAPAQAIAASGGGRVLPAGDAGAWAAALQEWAADPALRERWRQAVPLPMRIEEEAFLYEGLYRQALGTA